MPLNHLQSSRPLVNTVTLSSAAATVLIVVTVLPVAFVYWLLRRYELAMM
jgi:hypothetical protein